MLDVRVLAYVVPLAEQVLDDITPVIQVRNYADEDAVITGLIRIYRKSTDTLEYSSQLATTILAHGTQANIAALSAWSPGAPADHDYFVLAEILATSFLPGPPIRATLGSFTFDIKPGPMGPAPAAHHTTHENGGMDPVNVDGMPGVLAEPQTPVNHAATHEDGGADPLNVEDLPTTELDDTLVLRPDGAGGVVFAVNPAGVTDHGALTGLDDDDHPQYRLRHEIYYEHDFLDFNVTPWPWYWLAIATGTKANGSASSKHVGIVRFTSSTTANSGYFVRTQTGAQLGLHGGEQSRCWHRPQTLSGTTRRTGFHDSVNVNAPVDGAYIYQDPATGKISGRTMAASAPSVTGSDYQLVTNTWYLEVIKVNADASRVDFYLYDDAGALLWTDNLQTNIPTSWLGHGSVITNSGTTAVDLDDIDLLSMLIQDLRPNP
jgi:hypothetical protein